MPTFSSLPVAPLSCAGPEGSQLFQLPSTEQVQFVLLTGQGPEQWMELAEAPWGDSIHPIHVTEWAGPST